MFNVNNINFYETHSVNVMKLARD